MAEKYLEVFWKTEVLVVNQMQYIQTLIHNDAHS